MITTPLLEHQKKALDYLRGKRKCALGMFLGSGKSLVALAYAEMIGAKRILIVSDKTNTINTWPDQIYRHTDWEVDVRPDTPGEPKVFMEASILYTARPCVCVNYDYLKGKRSYAYAKVNWDLAILDESGEVKDQRTARYRALRRVIGRVPNVLLLNATLMTERLEDIYGQLALIGGRDYIGQTLTKFRTRFMQPDAQGYGWIPKRSALTQIQKAVKPISYWLEDDGSIQMPEVFRHSITVPMTPEQKELDHELKTYFSAAFGTVEVETNYAPVVYQKRIQLCGGVLRGGDSSEGSTDSYEEVPTGKLEVVRKLVKNNPESKIVLWHTYIPETEVLSGLLRANGIRYLVMDNSSKTDVLEQFQKPNGPRVLLIRTSLCKGLNQLADADIAVFYSNPLSYARRAQAEGRTRRVSSNTMQTHIVDILTEGGADEQVYGLLEQKKNFSLSLTALRKFV